MAGSSPSLARIGTNKNFRVQAMDEPTFLTSARTVAISNWQIVATISIASLIHNN